MRYLFTIFVDRDKIFRDLVSQETQQCDLSIWTNVNFKNVLHTQVLLVHIIYKLTGNLVFKNPANYCMIVIKKHHSLRDFSIEPKDGVLGATFC